MSGTFHGRDVFAPAAAHLSAGVSPSEFGPVLAEPVMLRGLFPSVEHDAMEGRIVRFDRFGNAISNIAFDFFKDFVGRPPLYDRALLPCVPVPEPQLPREQAYLSCRQLGIPRIRSFYGEPGAGSGHTKGREGEGEASPPLKRAPCSVNKIEGLFEGPARLFHVIVRFLDQAGHAVHPCVLREVDPSLVILCMALVVLDECFSTTLSRSLSSISSP